MKNLLLRNLKISSILVFLERFLEDRKEEPRGSSALAGATEYSVYAWARVDAVNGAEMPAVSTGPGSGSGAGYGWGGEERLHSLVQQVALLVTVART